MRSRAKTTESSKLHHQAEQLTFKLLETASRHFGTEFTPPRIRFDLRGKSAGQVRVADGGSCLIRYNAHLLERHPREFLSQTVPHETAHVVSFGLFGPRVAPHGTEWKAIMAIFGAPPRRCHDYAVEGLETRHLSRYDYRCACRVHKLTSIRHNRIRSGQVYLCKRCGRALEPIPEPAVR